MHVLPCVARTKSRQHAHIWRCVYACMHACMRVRVCTPQVLEYAARWHPDQEIVSKSVEGPITVSTYADLAQRAKLCAVALQRLGIRWVFVYMCCYG
jgi:hypothetical protein